MKKLFVRNFFKNILSNVLGGGDNLYCTSWL